MSKPAPDRVSALIIVEAAALAGWVPVLADALAKAWQANVRIRVVDTGEISSSLESLLALEKMVLRRNRPVWSDRLSRADIGDRLDTPAAPAPDVVIDLTLVGGNLWPSTTMVLRPCFDGAYGEAALAAALFFDGTPHIEIASQTGDVEPLIVASGTASLEAADGFGGAMEAVWSRTIPLIIKARQHPTVRVASTDGAHRPASRILKRNIAAYSAKSVAAAAARAAYRLCCHAPHWRIGWRRPENGEDVWSRRNLGGARWNVLADTGDHFYADPFPFHGQGKDHLFFEDLDHKTGKGIISVTTFGDDGNPGNVIPVLEEPWHLSYPFLIEQDGEIYMVPESSLSGEIPIYRAEKFPHRWVKEATLVDNVEAADATIVRHDGQFFMLAVIRDGIGGYSDTLAIWHAKKLLGPWHPHAQNPVLIDDRSARPAGNMIMRDGQLWRPVQDCRNGYGAALGLARIDRLDTNGFSQQVETILSPDRHWPGRKLHTLNSGGTIEAIDGSVIRPKFGLLQNLIDARMKPGG